MNNATHRDALKESPILISMKSLRMSVQQEGGGNHSDARTLPQKKKQRRAAHNQDHNDTQQCDACLQYLLWSRNR